jgi:hypothetical protein
LLGRSTVLDRCPLISVASCGAAADDESNQPPVTPGQTLGIMVERQGTGLLEQPVAAGGGGGGRSFVNTTSSSVPSFRIAPGLTPVMDT